MSATTTKRIHELQDGDVVLVHGMRCRITGPMVLSRAHAGGATYYNVARVLNRADVSNDAVPYAYTEPRLPNGYVDDEAVARGEHHWVIQSNDIPTWLVEVPS